LDDTYGPTIIDLSATVKRISGCYPATMSDLPSIGDHSVDKGTPSCPQCGSVLDESGLSFASKIEVADKVYFCNNPLCSCENQKTLSYAA